MEPTFSFKTFVPDNLICVAMSGFFAPNDVARFKVELEAALRTLNAGTNQHVMLVDIREMKIQPQDSVADFRNFFTDARLRSRRLAIVVASSLSRSQVKRAAEGRGAEYFISPAEARAWLLRPEPAIAAMNGHKIAVSTSACM